MSDKGRHRSEVLRNFKKKPFRIINAVFYFGSNGRFGILFGDCCPKLLLPGHFGHRHLDHTAQTRGQTQLSIHPSSNPRSKFRNCHSIKNRKLHSERERKLSFGSSEKEKTKQFKHVVLRQTAFLALLRFFVRPTKSQMFMKSFS